MITRSCLLRVFAGHTLLVLIEFLVNALNAESWTLFFSFLIDLPISMLFHSVLEGLALQSRLWALLGMHILLGGIWWMVIFCGGMKLVSGLREFKSNGPG